MPRRETLKKSAHAIFGAWLQRRIPPARETTLSRKHIFILPTAYGMMFGLVIAAVFLVGVNSGNSLILALTFFLSAISVVSILHTYQNLSGLVVEAGVVEDGFAGGRALFKLVLSCADKRPHDAIQLIWDHGSEARVCVLAGQRSTVGIFIDVKKRGVYKPGRLRVETSYPVGLLRAWSLVDLKMHSLVYPRPIKHLATSRQIDSQADGSEMIVPGVDDFENLRPYVPGDSLRHAHWKTLARSQPLHTKIFVSYRDENNWVSWYAFEGVDDETRLSYMSHLILKLTDAHQSYGLRLPGVEICPDQGPAHATKCLQRLALFDTGAKHGGSDRGFESGLNRGLTGKTP